jgi:hypothetical protein
MMQDIAERTSSTKQDICILYAEFLFILRAAINNTTPSPFTEDNIKYFILMISKNLRNMTFFFRQWKMTHLSFKHQHLK